MHKPHVSNLRGHGKLYDGDRFLIDCVYDLDHYHKLNARLPVLGRGRTNLLRIEGRIESPILVPKGVPLLLHLTDRHRLRIIVQHQGRVVGIGSVFEQF